MFNRVSLTEWIRHYSANRKWELMKQNTSTKEELMSKGLALCFINEYGTAGFAITRGWELVGVWSVERGTGDELIQMVIRLHINYKKPIKLDCFDGYLTEFYKNHGFKEYNRIKNFTKYAPDIVFMKLE